MSEASIRTALVSVHDKTGIVEFAQGLQNLNVKMLSTGGTAKLLREKAISVRDIGDYTGFPEILDGRVKTLHPKIHAGLLYRRDNQNDLDTIKKLGVETIDMVVVNLYPFEKVTSQPIDLEVALENIDIGGPTMIRSAAKNFRSVAVVTDPVDYPRILTELKNASCRLSERTRFELMLKAFQRTASYDTAISAYFLKQPGEHGDGDDWPPPSHLRMNFEKIQDLRYGENPHQRAAVYRDLQAPTCIALARMVAGEKELSYTNLLDADAAYRLIKEFAEENTTAIIKHTNPCGVGRGRTLRESCERALATDPVSAYGGVYAFSRTVDLDTAKILTDKFVELVLAPGYEPEALKALQVKKNRRILDISEILLADKGRPPQKTFRRILGGILYQESDDLLLDEQKTKVVTKRQPAADEEEAIRFAWRIAKYVKSNAIVLCSRDQLVGVGAGQMSRVDSCKISLMKAQQAGLSVQGTAMGSDAYLPFRDSVDLMAQAGVKAIIQPGGSIRDQEVIDAANEFGITMVFTGIRHFVH